MHAREPQIRAPIDNGRAVTNSADTLGCPGAGRRPAFSARLTERGGHRDGHEPNGRLHLPAFGRLQS